MGKSKYQKFSHKVSVCIPVYNGEKYIQEAVNSVIKQNIKDFELLVVDDCSTDKTVQVVQKIKDKRIKIHHNRHNLGMVGNWNRCLTLAKGEYVKLLMADDVLEAGALAKQIKILDRYPKVSVCYGYVRLIDEMGKIINDKNSFFNNDTYRLSKKSYLMSGFDCIRKYLQNDWRVGLPSAALVRRKCFDEFGLIDPDGIDQEMWARTCIKYDFYYLADLVCYWRIRSQGTYTSSNNAIKNFGRDFRRFAKMSSYKEIINDPIFRQEYSKLLANARFNNLHQGMELIWENLRTGNFSNLSLMFNYLFKGGNLDKKFH